MWIHRCCLIVFYFNDTATTEIYTLSLHDALPISESTEQLRPYFEGNYGDRGHWAGRRSYYPEDGWDRSLGGRLGSKASDAKTWLRFMDEGEVETAVLYPTAGLGIGWVREPDFATALCRAYN